MTDAARGSEGKGAGPGTAGLTTGSVARRFGVAPTTLRSWDQRYGIGPAARVGGKHRRWTAADLALLERMFALTNAGLPPAEAARVARADAASGAVPAPDSPPGSSPRSSPGSSPGADRAASPGGAPAPASPPSASETPEEPEEASRAGSGPEPASIRRTTRSAPPRPSRAGGGLGLGNARIECRGLARAALRLDAIAVDRLLEAAIAEHGLVTAWTEVIVPTLRAVGRKWQTSGERYVEVEHLLSWHVSTALHRRRGAPPERATDGLALLACVPGETHALPIEALASALYERGLPLRMFGAALPAEALIEAVRRTGPDVVVLWAQSRTTASRPLAQHVAQMTWGVRGARRRPVVLTVGPGWTAPRVPGTLRPLALAEAVDAVEAALHS
ncbi:MerR family transcriptional regulator [Streptomyces sp. NPDC054861]